MNRCPAFTAPSWCWKAKPPGSFPLCYRQANSSEGGVTFPESYSKLVPEPEQDPRNADGSSIHKAVNKYVLST